MMTLPDNFLKIGDRLPGVSLPSLAGGEIELQDFRGHKLIIFMWASW
jgi:peroxiredoxin